MKAVQMTWVVVIAVVAVVLGASAGYYGYMNQHGCETKTDADGKKSTTCTK